MSLVVWLPLNGDLHNQGLSNAIFSVPSDNTIVSGGKIGQCLHSTKISSAITVPSMAGGKKLSVCYWVKIGSAWSTQWLDGFRWSSTDGSTSYVSRQEFYNNCTLFGIWFKPQASTNRIAAKSFTVGEWIHLAYTLDYTTGKVCLYKNGKLLTETISLNTSHYIKSQFWLADDGVDLYQNDLRIYDHILSPKEVEEIAKGLVLHYKLDNNGMGGDNLALNTRKLDIASSKANLYMYRRGASTLQLRNNGFYEVKCTAAWQGLSFWANQLNLSVGTKITYSFYIYGNGSSRAFSFYPIMFNSAGTRDTSTGLPISVDGGTYTTANAKSFANTTATSPEYHYVTFEWNQAVANIITNGGSIELSIQVRGIWNSGDWACIFAPKVEIGDKPTVWSPAKSELGDMATTVYDCSGYSNNGTIVGDLTAAAPSPRYDVATKFSASSAINCGRGGMVTDSITVNVWAKYSSYSNLVSCTEGGGWNFENNNGLTFPVYISGVGYVHIDSASRPAVANYTNAWHMFTGVYDRIGQQTHLYIDGELIGTGAVSSPNPIQYHSTNVIWLNAEATGSNTTGSYGSAKQMSDFRIYATALTAAQIKELYNTSMSIDSNGNVYARELSEL